MTAALLMEFLSATSENVFQLNGAMGTLSVAYMQIFVGTMKTDRKLFIDSIPHVTTLCLTG
jgi:hypothetical protein